MMVPDRSADPIVRVRWPLVLPVVYVSVIVVPNAGVEMAWIRAPPSDHDAKLLVCPFTVWVAGASSVLIMPTTPVNVYGVVCGCPSIRTSRPDGLLANV